MDAKELFRNIRDIRGEIAMLEQRKKFIEESILPKAVRYDEAKVSSSPENPMDKFADKLSDLEERTQKRLNKLIDDNIMAERILTEMPTSKYRTLLYLRYIQGGLRYKLSWAEIARKMGYDEHHVKIVLHQKALKEAQQIYDKMKKS